MRDSGETSWDVIDIAVSTQGVVVLESEASTRCIKIINDERCCWKLLLPNHLKPLRIAHSSKTNKLVVIVEFYNQGRKTLSIDLHSFKDKTVAKHLKSPCAVTEDLDGNIIIADDITGALHVIEPDSGKDIHVIDAMLRGVDVQLTALRRGVVAVATAAANFIQAWDYNSKCLWTYRHTSGLCPKTMCSFKGKYLMVPDYDKNFILLLTSKGTKHQVSSLNFLLFFNICIQEFELARDYNICQPIGVAMETEEHIIVGTKNGWIWQFLVSDFEGNQGHPKGN